MQFRFNFSRKATPPKATPPKATPLKAIPLLEQEHLEQEHLSQEHLSQEHLSQAYLDQESFEQESLKKDYLRKGYLKKPALTPKQADIVYKLKYQEGTITENRQTGYINLDTAKDGVFCYVISQKTLESLKRKGMITAGKATHEGSNLIGYQLKQR